MKLKIIQKRKIWGMQMNQSYDLGYWFNKINENTYNILAYAKTLSFMYCIEDNHAISLYDQLEFLYSYSKRTGFWESVLQNPLPELDNYSLVYIPVSKDLFEKMKEVYEKTSLPSPDQLLVLYSQKDIINILIIKIIEESF